MSDNPTVEGGILRWDDVTQARIERLIWSTFAHETHDNGDGTYTHTFTPPVRSTDHDPADCDCDDCRRDRG